MPFDSNGTFNRLRSWVSDAAANTLIRSDYHDSHDQDIAAGLSMVITKDGRTQPIANLPMNNHRLINVQDPVAPQDVATRNYVDHLQTFNTGLTITGVNMPNGMLAFAATTNYTGVSWTNADMSWLGKVAEANKWPQRLTVNSKADGSGTDLVAIDKAGNINIANGNIANNLSYDGTTWRTDAAGTGTLLRLASGIFSLQNNDTATTVANGATTLSTFFTVGQDTIDLNNQLGSASFLLHKQNGTGGFGCYLYGMVGTQVRWRMDLGDGAAESGGAGSYTGSNFAVYACDNTGVGYRQAFAVDRSTNAFTAIGEIHTNGQNFVSNTTNVVLAGQGGGVFLRPSGPANGAGQFTIDASGNATAVGTITSGQTFQSNTTNAILASQGGGVYLRPNGAGSSAREAKMQSSGFFNIQGGVQTRQGLNGADGGNCYTIYFVAGPNTCQLRIDDSYMGNFAFTCDYRIKKDIKPLGSMWEGIKKLRTISYTHRKYEIFEDSDIEHWGLIAHEAQEALFPGIANGEKDGKDLQNLNLVPIVTALTKGLQEAMLRIEALEARA